MSRAGERSRHPRTGPSHVTADVHHAPGSEPMPLVTTASLIDQARQHREGLGAFNVITLEHAEAVGTGAEEAGRPAIMQISENAIRYHQGQLGPLAGAVATVAEQATMPLSVHLDHVQNEGLMRQAADSGITSVMFDASQLSYQDNVRATQEAATWARSHGMWLEAELGEIGGKDGAHAPGVRTDPREALAFVAGTAVDGLAVAVGSSHAMVDRTAALDLDLIRTLASTVQVPLVLHGSSGVPDSMLQAAVGAGVVKVNIGTILNVAMTTAVRAALEDTALVDPRKYLGPGRDAVAREVQRLLTVLKPATP
jgi:fructose-bisphosphate aldolase, class II